MIFRDVIFCEQTAKVSRKVSVSSLKRYESGDETDTFRKKGDETDTFRVKLVSVECRREDFLEITNKQNILHRE